MISAVNYWLHRLGINCFKVHCKTVKHSLLVDRLRNGIILCDLAVLLEPKLTQSLNFFDCVNYNPSNVMDCKINLCAALNVFKGAKCPPIHAKLLIDPETIMIGDNSFIFNLMYEIMNSYERAAGFIQTPTHWFKLANRSKGWLPYTPLERQRLEECLVQWLIDNGTLEKLGLHDRLMRKKKVWAENSLYTVTRDEITGKMKEFLSPNLMDLESVLFDGTLLCTLCETILPEQRRGLVKGWIKQPKTRGSKLNNSTKVLNGLKGWFNRDDCCDGCRGGGVGMSGRWLQEGFEGRIVDGNWQQILGLLEDCFRCSDGMVGKKEVMIGPEVPYFGKYVGVFGRGAEGKWEGEEKKEEKKEHMYHVKVPVDPFFSDLSPQKHHGGKKPVNFISSNFPFEEDEPTEHEIIPHAETRSGGHEFYREVEVETEKSNQRGNYNDLLVIAGAQADALFEEAKRKNAVDGALKSARDRAEKILLSFANKQGEVEVEVEAPSPTPTPTPKITPTENLPSFQKPKMNDVYVVSKWLSTKLNIEIDDPKALLQAPYISSEFMSGLKLVRICEKLLRWEINGINRYPKTKAARVSNSRRALEALFSSLKPNNVSSELKASSRNAHEEVAKGNGFVIVELLMGLLRLYGYRRVD